MRTGFLDIQDVIKAIAATREFRDAIFEKLRMRKLSIDNSLGDWRRYYDAITDFLSLPPIELSVRSSWKGRDARRELSERRT